MHAHDLCSYHFLLDHQDWQIPNKNKQYQFAYNFLHQILILRPRSLNLWEIPPRCTLKAILVIRNNHITLKIMLPFHGSLLPSDNGISADFFFSFSFTKSFTKLYSSCTLTVIANLSLEKIKIQYIQ